MDSIISAALEEICVRGPAGILLRDLWPSLQNALLSSGLHPCDGVKRAIWCRLLNLPGPRFEANGSTLGSQDPSIQSHEESVKLGLRLYAEKSLRESFLGLYDLAASFNKKRERKNLEASSDKKRKRKNPVAIVVESKGSYSGGESPWLDLEVPIRSYCMKGLHRHLIYFTSFSSCSLIASFMSSRSNGITQSELAREFDMKGNKLFYIVKNLECQQLIVRKSTVVRRKEIGTEGENIKSTIVNTNLLCLHRYAKTMMLNRQQKVEITRPYLLGSFGNVDGSSLIGDTPFGECVKEDHCIKDYLPELKVVCDKLEEASEKVLVVSDIKLALGYWKTAGHRAWRNILSRLKDAHLVEEISAKVNKRVNSFDCVRVVDPSHRAKYFLRTFSNCNPDLNLISYVESQVMNNEASQRLQQKHGSSYCSQQGSICTSHKDSSTSLCDGNKVTIPEEPAKPYIETRSIKDGHATFEACVQVEAACVQQDEGETIKCHGSMVMEAQTPSCTRVLHVGFLGLSCKILVYWRKTLSVEWKS